MSEPDLSIRIAKEFLGENKPGEALAILDKLAVQNSGEVIFLKGEIFFKLQQWGEALNHFSLYLEQYPADTKAQSYCTMIQNILDFYHKDLYNP